MTAAPLTGILDEITSVAGEPAAIAIAAAVGGTPVYIPTPKRLTEKHWLVQCVGRRAAEKLATHFASESRTRVLIPLAGGGAYPQLRRAIAKRIHDLDRAGKSSREIARSTGVTTRAVHRHRRAHRGQAKAKGGKQGVLL